MDNLNYYKLYTSAPFCGTDETVLIISDQEYAINEDEIRESLYDSYGYLIHGWDEEDPTEEEYEDFKADCEIIFEKISKEQLEQEHEENGWDIEMYKM